MNQSWKRDYFRYKEYLLTTVNVYKGRPDVRLFLEILLSIITITFFSAFAIRPTIYTILDLSKDIKAKEETIAQLDKKINDIKKARTIYQIQQENIALLKTAVPNNHAVDSLATNIEAIANNNGVNLQNLSAQKVAILGPEQIDNKAVKLPLNAQTLGVSLNVDGEFGSLFNFLRDLSNSLRPLRGSLNITTQDTNDKHTILVTITGFAPYLKQQ